ncbi:hypothetical protein BDR06DRAFT_947030, partial [Suillus hirtellus]
TPQNTDVSSHARPVTTSHCSPFRSFVPVLSYGNHLYFHELVPIQNGSRYYDNTTIKTTGNKTEPIEPLGDGNRALPIFIVAVKETLTELSLFFSRRAY